MNKIVFGNLGLLDIYLRDQVLISEGNELSLMGKDDYDTVEKLSSLEYIKPFDIIFRRKSML